MAAKQEMNKKTVEDESELKCDMCYNDNDPVVALCADCKLYLCQDCNKVHSKIEKTHNILCHRAPLQKKDLLLS